MIPKIFITQWKKNAPWNNDFQVEQDFNTREHFTVFGYNKFNYSIENEWYQGNCDITTFLLEELLSTKMRALYQRRKGRDLFDLYYAIKHLKPDSIKIVEGFKQYLANENLKVTQNEFISNMEDKIADSEFIGDITALLRPTIEYNFIAAWKYIKQKLIKKLY